jgi:hypothetical protein
MPFAYCMARLPYLPGLEVTPLYNGAIPSSQVTLESTGGRRLLHRDEYIRQQARLFKTADSLSTS